MMFAKQLRDRVMLGEITCSVRIWQRPHVKVGGSYRLGPGHIHVSSVRVIGFDGITDELARRSGFDGIDDLMAVAKHGPGDTVYLVEFDYRE
jgi:hypothetical protein